MLIQPTGQEKRTARVYLFAGRAPDFRKKSHQLQSSEFLRDGRRPKGLGHMQSLCPRCVPKRYSPLVPGVKIDLSA